jgi:hypothetical protein
MYNPSQLIRTWGWQQPGNPRIGRILTAARLLGATQTHNKSEVWEEPGRNKVLTSDAPDPFIAPIVILLLQRSWPGRQTPAVIALSVETSMKVRTLTQCKSLLLCQQWYLCNMGHTWHQHITGAIQSTALLFLTPEVWVLFRAFLA